MWSLTVLNRHALYGDYRVTEGCWVECESQVRVCGVDRLCEACGEVRVYSRISTIFEDKSLDSSVSGLVCPSIL